MPPSEAPVIRVCHTDAADPNIPLPAYASPGAAGADMRANLPFDQRHTGIQIPPGAVISVPTGMMMKIPAGFEGQIRPRSGLALHHRITLPNAPATIDSDYRGVVAIPLVNHGTRAFVVTHGMRIAQLVIAPVAQARFKVAAALAPTLRGTGGFGSTGLT